MPTSHWRLDRILELPAWPPQRWRCFVILVVVSFALVAAGKLLIAANVELFWDETFNWQSGYRPAWSYVETPFITALLVRAGVELFGDTAFGVRSLFLAMWFAIPWLVYWIARPIGGPRHALMALLLALAFPVTSGLGLVATADTPMAFFALLALGAFERALRSGRSGWWCALGAALALGLATHIRFVAVPGALLVFVVATSEGRALIGERRPWLAGLIAAIGLVPIVLGGLDTDFQGVRFGFSERHPWNFDPRGLLHLLIQSAVASPLYYAALLATLVYAVIKARRGNRAAAMIAAFSGVYLGTFALLAPWADRRHFNLHWPAIGYLPLLALMPQALIAGIRAARTPKGRAARGLFALAVPVSGALVLLGALLFLAGQVWPRLSPVVVDRVFREPIMGWAGLAGRTALLLKRGRGGGPPLIAAIDFKVASQLAFHLGGRVPVYVLRHRDNETYGMWPQYILWGLDQPALRREHKGARALILVEQRHYQFHNPAHVRWRAGLCALFDDIRFVGDHEFPHGRRHYEFYSGVVRPPGAPAPARVAGPANCGAMPTHYIAQPKRGQTVRGIWDIWGWAIDEASGVRGIEVLVDGKPVGVAKYGNVLNAGERSWMAAARDPQIPNIAFTFKWDTRTLAEGRHILALRVTTNQGNARIIGRRTVFVVHR